MYLVIPILRPLGVGFAHSVKQQISCLFGFPNNPQCSAWGRGSPVQLAAQGLFASLGSGYPNGRRDQGCSGEKKWETHHLKTSESNSQRALTILLRIEGGITPPER